MPSTVNQAYVFLATVYAGFVIGFVYDLFRMIRQITRPGKLVTGLLDLVFWLLMAILSFLVVFKVNYGVIRLYTIAGLAIGWGLYAFVLSPFVFKLLIGIYKLVAGLCKWIARIIAWPFKKLFFLIGLPFGLLKKLFRPIFSKSKALVSRIFPKEKIKNISS